MTTDYDYDSDYDYNSDYDYDYEYDYDYDYDYEYDYDYDYYDDDVDDDDKVFSLFGVHAPVSFMMITNYINIVIIICKLALLVQIQTWCTVFWTVQTCLQFGVVPAHGLVAS